MSGRHAEASRDPQHWAYWQREQLAYESGVLPSGQTFRAPRFYGVDENAIFLEDVQGDAEDPNRAAERLGHWQSSATIPDVNWLSGHQLVQRIADTDLDWSQVGADPRAERLWVRWPRLLEQLCALPQTLSHGDFHTDNLLKADDGTVVLDWAALGVAPVGADLAHLSLSTLADHTEAYLTGLGAAHSAAEALFGFRATLILIGASRVHWCLSTGTGVPEGYVDFLWDNAPPFDRLRARGQGSVERMSSRWVGSRPSGS